MSGIHIDGQYLLAIDIKDDFNPFKQVMGPVLIDLGSKGRQVDGLGLAMSPARIRQHLLSQISRSYTRLHHGLKARLRIA